MAPPLSPIAVNITLVSSKWLFWHVFLLFVMGAMCVMCGLGNLHKTK